MKFFTTSILVLNILLFSFTYGDTNKANVDQAVEFFNQKQYDKAFPLLLNSAKAGNSEAQFVLGLCYRNGKGVPIDLDKAITWYTKAAEQNIVGAQHNLGNLYRYSDKKNPKKAVHWYRKAAEQGLDRAQYSLGLVYSKGDGVPQNPKEAARWFKKAAEQDYMNAQYSLAIRYDDGNGVQKDKKEAEKWYLKAAEQGMSESQYFLAILYCEGDGIAKDLKKCAHWLKRSAKDGEDISEIWDLYQLDKHQK